MHACVRMLVLKCGVFFNMFFLVYVVYSKYIRTSLMAVFYVNVYACVWFHTQY